MLRLKIFELLPLVTAMNQLRAMHGVLMITAAVLASGKFRGARPLCDTLRPVTQSDASEYRPDCAQPDACLDKKYMRHLATITDHAISQSQAAEAFCSETTWPERTSAYTAQLLARCVGATRRRMACDLNGGVEPQLPGSDETTGSSADQF
jgi:hypothetical protein